jgi:peptide/nickel transport system permease protein
VVLEGGEGAAWPVQYLRWLWRLARLDLGPSLTDGRPVVARLAEALPHTLLLSGLSLGVSCLLALGLGALAALRQGRAVDRFIGLLVFVLVSLPGFWVAVLLMVWLAGPRGPELFPLQGLVSPGHAGLSWGGRVLDVLWHLALPVTCLSLGAVATLTRYARAALLEALSADFVLAARARGLSAPQVLWRHALRHALTPLVTLLALLLPGTLGGSVLVEHVFGIPGMGLLLLEALERRDVATVMGATVLVAGATLLAGLAADLVHQRLDPRLAREQA